MNPLIFFLFLLPNITTAENIYDQLERNFDDYFLENCLFYRGNNLIVVNPTYHDNYTYGGLSSMYNGYCFKIIEVLIINDWEIKIPLEAEQSQNLDMIMLVKNNK